MQQSRFLQLDEEANLIINEEIEITVRTDAPEHLENLSTIYSGWVFRSDETQALQMDDFENPGMIFVDDAIDAWNTVEGSAGESCASCHAACRTARRRRRPSHRPRT